MGRIPAGRPRRDLMDRGDIWHVDLNPVSGREQRGQRYVLVVSRRRFNQLGTPLCVPITQGGDFARRAGFAAQLTGAGTKTAGVVLCHQLRTLDLSARKATFIERVPDFVIDDVMSRIQAILD